MASAHGQPKLRCFNELIHKSNIDTIARLCPLFGGLKHASGAAASRAEKEPAANDDLRAARAFVCDYGDRHLNWLGHAPI
jgi:hypothetical protein